MKKVIDLFDTADVVLLGERHGFAENLDFLIKSIGPLATAGISRIALEFSAQELQEQSDALVLGNTYDPQVSRDMLFAYNVGWPYLEYQKVHQAVWENNQISNAKLRVLHPSYIYDWSKWTGRRDLVSMASVMHRGDYNQFRAQTIAKSVQTGQKVLGLFGAIHATRDRQSLNKLGLSDEFQSIAMNLEQIYGMKVATVNLNGALEARWDVELTTSSTMSACAIDRGFLRGRDFQVVQANWPDPDWTPAPTSEAEYWQIISSRLM